MELCFLHISDRHLEAGARDPVTTLAQVVVNASLLRALRGIAPEGRSTSWR